MPTAKPTRRSRPLRCEEPEHLFFVTTRTLEEVFWLHPLLCSRLAPVNREARRVVEAKRSRLRTKLERLVASANRRRPENQPKLTVEEAEKLAEDCVSSALARALEHCGICFTNRCSDGRPHRSRSTAWPIDPNGRAESPSGGVAG
jgi:hypothetical protein